MFSLNEEYLNGQSVPLTMMSSTMRKLGQYQGKQALLQQQKPAQKNAQIYGSSVWCLESEG